MDSGKIKIIILAAGKGTRMQSDLPKVLVPLSGIPLIQRLLDKIKGLPYGKPHIVVGHSKEKVIKELGDTYNYIVQEEQLGTGHALSMAKEAAGDAKHIVVLQGDQPFTSAATIDNMIHKHTVSGAKITFATTEVPDFEDWRKVFSVFGRIVRKGDAVAGIIENKDATAEEKNIREVNAGCYVFDAAWLWSHVQKINNQNSQKEYYLTDLIKLAIGENEKVETIGIDPREALGANSKEELDILEKFVV